MSFLSGLKKVGSVVGRGLSAVAPVASFIPGVGAIGALGMAAAGAGLRKVTAQPKRPAAAPPAAPPVTAQPQDASIPFVPDVGRRRSASPITAIPQNANTPRPNLSIGAGAPAAAAPAPVAGTSPITPGAGLRGRRIDANVPDRDPYRLDGAAAYRAAVGSTDLAGGPAVDPTTSARTAAAQARTSGAADSLASGPDRVAMARQSLADFETQLGESRREGIRDIGKSAAALGRVGSGMTTGKLADLERRVQSDRSIETNRLVSDLTERDAADRFAKLDAFRGLEGDAAGMDAANRSELRSERAYRDAVGEGNLSRRMQVGDTAFRAGETRADTGVDDAARRREQLIGERGYEDALAGEAYNRELDTIDRQAQFDREDFSRGLALDGVGYAGDPSGLEFGVAGRRAAQAADLTAGAAGLLGQRARDEAFGGDPAVLGRRRVRRTDTGTILNDRVGVPSSVG